MFGESDDGDFDSGLENLSFGSAGGDPGLKILDRNRYGSGPWSSTGSYKEDLREALEQYDEQYVNKIVEEVSRRVEEDNIREGRRIRKVAEGIMNELEYEFF